MSDWYNNIFCHATDPRNVIERVEEMLGDWYDVRAMYDVATLTNTYHIYNASSGVTVRVDITDKMVNELGLLLPEFIAQRVRVETLKHENEKLKKEVDEPLFTSPSKPTPLVLYFKSKEKKEAWK
jgi:hypothetical protein